jgi:hypothetical protein
LEKRVKLLSECMDHFLVELATVPYLFLLFSFRNIIGRVFSIQKAVVIEKEREE